MKKCLFLLCLLLCVTCFFCACEETETPEPEPQAPTHTHEWGEWRTSILATCSTEGQEKRLCACGEVEKRVVPVTQEHTFTEKSMTEDYEYTSTVFQTEGVYCYKCIVCGAKSTKPYMTENARVYFGEYPQTLKASDVTITETTDSRGYFLGSDGAYYAKLSATPNASGYTFSSGEGVIKDEVYYFKVEPIAWRILSIKDGSAMLLCDSIIDNRPFNNGYGNDNYADSSIRTWLNSDFLNIAFSATAQECVATSSITSNPGIRDLTGIVPGYVHGAPKTTEDKIFLLSKEEFANTAYGLNTKEARKMKASDYTLANGIQADTNWNGYAAYWQRDLLQRDNVYIVNNEGAQTSTICVGTQNYVGVVPALTLNLS
ncbi:MAG: hypothetical protein J6B09_07960 [Clostridia bacterium]|nr:hypothetical protein [Clostridia bacterium]